MAEAATLARQGEALLRGRGLHRLRGEWRLTQGEWALAAASYQEAVRLARERSLTEAGSETGLALAKVAKAAGEAGADKGAKKK